MRHLYRTLLRTILCIAIFSSMPLALKGQHMALKTNLLSDLTTTINLGLETSLAPKWSLDISGNYNAWEFKDYRKQKQWMVQPEARFWF